MRVKAQWFREGGSHGPEEVGGAVAFIAFRVAQNMLKSMRKAQFDIDVGPAYFDFLAEALAFAIQAACRVAYPALPEEQRLPFATALAQHAADHLAGNEAELLGLEAPIDIRARFIERLNRRFAEYADFAYGAEGPDFLFLRYFASLVAERMPEKDRRWTHDQVIAIEGPEAARTIAKSVASLLDTSPRERRRASSTRGE
ncbi:MAG: hypothetical protein ACM3X5_09710 [Bacillota bacterium]